MRRPRTTDLQIRGFPIALRERLRKRARSKGLSMSQYVVEKLQQDLGGMDWDEWVAELRKLPPVDTKGVSAEEIMREVRAEEDAEDAELWP